MFSRLHCRLLARCTTTLFAVKLCWSVSSCSRKQLLNMHVKKKKNLGSNGFKPIGSFKSNNELCVAFSSKSNKYIPELSHRATYFGPMCLEHGWKRVGESRCSDKYFPNYLHRYWCNQCRLTDHLQSSTTGNERKTCFRLILQIGLLTHPFSIY